MKTSISPSDEWRTIVNVYRHAWAEALHLVGNDQAHYRTAGTIAATLFIEANRRGLRLSMEESERILRDPYEEPCPPAGPHAAKLRITSNEELPA